MAQLARSKFLHLRFAEEVTFNAEAFLQGTLELFSHTHLTLYSALVGRDVRLDADEIRWLQTLPESQWLDADAARPDGFPANERFWELVREGVVLYDAEDAESDDASAPPEAAELLDRHRLLDEIPWHPTSLHVHLTNQDAEHGHASKAEPVDLAAKTREAKESAESFLEKRGEPPPAFYRPPQARGETLDLEPGERHGGLYETLTRRRTGRGFEPEGTVDRETFSSLMRYTFGCLGRHVLSPRFFSLHKTVPSGGSLHPIEAYPVISRVDGIEPGFYHYDTRRHGLSPIAPMDRSAVAERLVRLAQGQIFASEAHFVVLLVARFQRNFWKYRKRVNTFHVVLKDAGHLSQTFQLVATDLGLGCFYTGAIDPLGILETLGFDPRTDRYHHGPIGILGAGVQRENDPTLLPLVPYDPLAERES